MYKKLLLSCLLALTASTQAVMPAPGYLTHAIAKILFYLPFLDVAGFISADIIEDENEFLADIIWAAHGLSDQDITVNQNDLEPTEDTLFFEGFIDGEDSSIQIWKFNRNPDACFRIRVRFRTAETLE